MRYLIAVLVVASGCVAVEPREGDECSAAVCAFDSERRILDCIEGRYRAFDCNGGCRIDTDGSAFCDPTGASAGDTCPPALGFTFTCGASGGRMLCFSGIWQEFAPCEMLPGDDFVACDTDNKGINAQCFSCGYGAPALCTRNN
jgi:hypothetical protein